MGATVGPKWPARNPVSGGRNGYGGGRNAKGHPEERPYDIRLPDLESNQAGSERQTVTSYFLRRRNAAMPAIPRLSIARTPGSGTAVDRSSPSSCNQVEWLYPQTGKLSVAV